MSGRLWLGLFVALSVIIGTQAQVPQDGERVRFLVISDTHVEPFEPLDDFIANLKTRDFDYILLSGDLNNLKVPEQADNQTAVIACEENIRITFNKLGHAFGFDKTIFWVPGNHDPPTMFPNRGDTFIQMTNNSVNLHNTGFTLRPSLVLFGWGGSVSSHQDGQVAWPGWPYTEEEVFLGVDELLDSVVSPGQSALLLSHVGPQGSSTTIVTSANPESMDNTTVLEPSNYIFSGSRSMLRILSSLDSQNKVRVHVHGHTHQGQGQASIGATRVLNAGSVRYTSSFGFLTLRFASVPNKWVVSSSSFHRFVPGYPSDGGFEDVCDHEDSGDQLLSSSASSLSPFSFCLLFVLVSLVLSSL